MTNYRSRCVLTLVVALTFTGCATTALPSPAGPPVPALSTLAAAIDAIVGQPAFEHSYWGILVKSLKNGDTPAD